jgi:hypothetical protein
VEILVFACVKLRRFRILEERRPIYNFHDEVEGIPLGIINQQFIPPPQAAINNEQPANNVSNENRVGNTSIINNGINSNSTQASQSSSGRQTLTGHDQDLIRLVNVMWPPRKSFNTQCAAKKHHVEQNKALKARQLCDLQKIVTNGSVRYLIKLM